MPLDSENLQNKQTWPESQRLKSFLCAEKVGACFFILLKANLGRQ